MNGITIKKYILKISLFLSLLTFAPTPSWAYNITAIDIYKQAHFRNYRFLDWLSIHHGVIDTQNRLGDTAYCIALKYHDRQTMEILASYNANTMHPCVRRAHNEYSIPREFYPTAPQTANNTTNQTNTPYIAANSTNNNYLWWGLGGLLVGGGIGALAASSGGGSHKTYVIADNNDNPGNNPGDNPGGNNPGNEPGGNNPGDEPGGNNPGDEPGGDNPGDDPGGNNPGDEPGGNNPGDEPGGDNPGDEPGGDNLGDEPGGDNPGDEPGGNNPGDEPGGNNPGNEPGGNNPGDEPGGNNPGNEPGGDNPGDEPGGDNPGDEPGGNNPGNEPGGNNPGDEPGGNNPGDEPGGDNPGDEPGGNNPGDEPGGNNPGDEPGGNNPGDEPGGNNPGDEPGGNNPGDNPGGNNGGSEDGNSGNSRLTDISSTAFKTSEYNKSNFLDTIRAAEAYSIIYKQDENGNLVSHQAASEDALKKVKVGVIDSGVYNNHSEFNDKIVGNYDANSYNNKGNVWGYTRNYMHYYVFYQNGKYYFLVANTNNSPISVYPFKNMDLTALNQKLAEYSLTLNQFTLMNGSNGGNPGTSDSEFDANDINSWWEIAAGMSHGTHVAGIIAANKDENGMHGVAFENAQIYAGSWDMEQSIYNMTQTMVDNGVGIINNSWGYTSTSANASNPNWLKTHDYSNILNAYAYAASHDVVWVQSTGNEGLTEAGVQNGIGLLDLSSYGYSGPGQYEVPYVAVAALDSSTATTTAPLGRIADYSNWCGSAKDFCITAPGTDVNSTAAINNGYIAMDGTSMATPVVSGSIALLMGYYPYLSGQNIAWLLLETANHSGAYSDSSIYGRGILDLNAALTTPAGSLSSASTPYFNSLQPVNQNKLNLNGSTQKQLAKALPEKITVFDELHRPFEYNTANLVSETHASNANFRNKVSHAALGGTKKTIKDEKTGFSFTQSKALDKGGKENLSFIEVVHETEDGSATRFYYTENSKYMVTDVVTPTNNPYFAMNDAYGAENTWKLNDSSKLKLSLQTGENGMYERDYEQDRTSFTERSYAFNAEYSFNLTDYLELSTIGGMLFEENAMLGMNGQGGFAIRDGSTYYMGLKAALNLTPNLTLLAAYYRGYTQGQETSMLALSNIETESYMLAGEYKLSPLHKIGLSLSSPLSIAKGKASFKYANGRDNYSDTIYIEKLTTSLKPAAKEYDLGLYYKGTPNSNLNLLGKVETRFNADGEKGLTDYLGIVGMQYTFPK